MFLLCRYNKPARLWPGQRPLNCSSDESNDHQADVRVATTKGAHNFRSRAQIHSQERRAIRSSSSPFCSSSPSRPESSFCCSIVASQEAPIVCLSPPVGHEQNKTRASTATVTTTTTTDWSRLALFTIFALLAAKTAFLSTSI